MLYIRGSKRGTDGFGNKGSGRRLSFDMVRLYCPALFFDTADIVTLRATSQ